MTTLAKWTMGILLAPVVLVLALLLLWGVFTLLAAIPLPVAIIVGALVIAWAARRHC